MLFPIQQLRCSTSRPLLVSPDHRENVYRRRRASRSDSSKHRMSSSRTRKQVSINSRLPTCLEDRFDFQVFRIVDIPGPLTLRIIERVWSSMNSTRTWVTPPREPIPSHVSSNSICSMTSRRLCTVLFRVGSLSDEMAPGGQTWCCAWDGSQPKSTQQPLSSRRGPHRAVVVRHSGKIYRTGTAEDAGDLDELDGGLGAIHFV